MPAKKHTAKTTKSNFDDVFAQEEKPISFAATELVADLPVETPPVADSWQEVIGQLVDCVAFAVDRLKMTDKDRRIFLLRAQRATQLLRGQANATA
jgi:hypothetical protein